LREKQHRGTGWLGFGLGQPTVSLERHCPDPALLDADGLPFALDRFKLDGRVPSLEALVDSDLAGTPVPIDRSVAGGFRHRGLTNLDVVTFPGG